MRGCTYILLLTVVVSFLFSGCTVEKRHHMPGYSFQWFSKQKNPDKQRHTFEARKHRDVSKLQAKDVNAVSPTNDFETMLEASATQEPVEFQTPIRKPLHHVAPKHSKTFTGDHTGKQHSVTKQADTISKVKTPSAKGPGGKSQLIALILCLFVGFFGVHRFYLGYVGIGVAQIILTLCCGVGVIWVLIDLVRIILGDLKPKDGEYEETL